MRHAGLRRGKPSLCVARGPAPEICGLALVCSLLVNLSSVCFQSHRESSRTCTNMFSVRGCLRLPVSPLQRSDCGISSVPTVCSCGKIPSQILVPAVTSKSRPALDGVLSGWRALTKNAMLSTWMLEVRGEGAIFNKEEEKMTFHKF